MLRINSIILEQIPGNPKVIESIDRNIEENVNNLFTQEEMNDENANGFPSHLLVLKNDAIIMCLRNYDSHNAVCNGTRLRISNIFTKYGYINVFNQQNFGKL